MKGSRSRHLCVGLLPTLLLLAALPLAGTAGAQEPPDPPNPNDAGEWFGVIATADRGATHIEYLGRSEINVTITDVSKGDGEPLQSGQLFLSAEVLGNDTRGWTASPSLPALNTKPGQVHEIQLVIQAGATIVEPSVQVRLNIFYNSRIGQDFATNLTVLAVAQPHPVVSIQSAGALPEFSPDQEHRIPVRVRNLDYYPNMVLFNVQAPEGWVVSPPSSLHLAPGEERTVLVDVKAPQDPWFRLNPTGDVVLISAESAASGGGVRTLSISTPISGYFLPGWVVPHIVLLFMGAAVLAKRTKDKHEERKLEKGKPVYPGLPVEKEAELEALKQTDPDRAERMEERLKELHGKRLAAWKQVYKKRKEQEKELRKREKERHDAILREQKEQERKRKKAEKARRKKLRKLRKQKRKKRKRMERKQQKAEKRAAKARREEEKRLAREMREKEQQKEKRAKLRKEQEKRKRKELEAKRKRLKELRKEKERSGDDGDPWWKFWRT